MGHGVSPGEGSGYHYTTPVAFRAPPPGYGYVDTGHSLQGTRPLGYSYDTTDRGREGDKFPGDKPGIALHGAISNWFLRIVRILLPPYRREAEDYKRISSPTVGVQQDGEASLPALEALILMNSSDIFGHPISHL